MKALAVILLSILSFVTTGQVRVTTIPRTDSVNTTPLTTTNAAIWLTRSNPVIKVKVKEGNTYSFATSFVVDSIKLALNSKMSLADVNGWWAGTKTSLTAQLFANLGATYFQTPGTVNNATAGHWGYSGLLGTGSTFARIHFNPISGYTNSGRIVLTAWQVGSTSTNPVSLTLSGGSQPGAPKGEGTGSWTFDRTFSNYFAGTISSNAFTATLGAGAGTGAIVLLDGDNLSGKISLTTGASPIGSSPVITLSWTQPIVGAGGAVVTLTPGNAQATTGQFYVDNMTGSSFRISTNLILNPSTTYMLNYAVHHH